MGNTGTRFSNIQIKKKHKQNIFSGDRTLNFDSGVKIDRTILPNTTLSALNSPNGSAKGSMPRIGNNPTVAVLAASNKQNDTFISLKRQIKELRDLLKERDERIMALKFSNIPDVNSLGSDRQDLLQEINRLKDHISLLQGQQDKAPEKKISIRFDKIQKDLDSTKKQLAGIKTLKSDVSEYKEKYEAILISSNAKEKQLNDIIKEKSKIIESQENAIRQKDLMIQVLCINSSHYLTY